MPTVALRGLVVFPGMGITFDVGRTRSLQAIKAAMADDQQIFLVAQKDVRDDDPDFDKLYKIGTIAKISHILRLPNSDTVRVSVDGIARATMVDMLQCEPYLITDVKIRREITVKSDDKDYATALVRQTKDYFEDYAEVVPQMPAEIILDVLEKTIRASLPTISARTSCSNTRSVSRFSMSLIRSSGLKRSAACLPTRAT